MGRALVITGWPAMPVTAWDADNGFAGAEFAGWLVGWLVGWEEYRNRQGEEGGDKWQIKKARAMRGLVISGLVIRPWISSCLQPWLQPGQQQEQQHLR